MGECLHGRFGQVVERDPVVGKGLRLGGGVASGHSSTTTGKNSPLIKTSNAEQSRTRSTVRSAVIAAVEEPVVVLESKHLCSVLGLVPVNLLAEPVFV